MYLIVRTDHGRREYVAVPGEKSFTVDLRSAKIFRTKEEAERYRCPGNESIVPLESELRGLD